ncbi:MAG: acyl--CoA ligase [Clostridia bacterium]|nr:acyl--CoA ligase [Clostridia bacterium]
MKRERNIWSDNHSPENFRPEYPEFSMVSLLKETAEKYPDYYALNFQNKKTTFAQMIKQIELVAQSLLASGVKKGDFVSVVAPNTPQALVSVYAINRIGAVANMIHPLLSANEIKRFIEHVDSKAIITFDMFYSKLSKVTWETTDKPVMILARIADALPFYLKPLYLAKNKVEINPNPNHDVIYWNDFLKRGKQRKEPLPVDDGQGDDIAAILYSGGTTGIPKGVMIHNRAFNCMAVQAEEIKRDNTKDAAGKKALALMPVFHGFGLAMCMHVMLYFGMQVFLVPKFDFIACSKLIFKNKINHVYAVPALFEALSRTEEIEKKDLSFLEMVAFSGDKCSDKLHNRMNRYLKNGGSSEQMTEAYGLTECLSAACISPFFAHKQGSTGLPLPDNKIKICKVGTHEEAPRGEDGEICITGPTLMKGYYKNEAETKIALQQHDDGKTWLHTGDLGYMDEDGYLWYRQRHCKMIITSGYNIYPSQIEEVINGCNGVTVSCVVGIEDRSVGQRVIAVVQPTSMDADLETLRKRILEECKKNVAEYAMPREVIFKEAIPRTAMGKVNFKALTAEMNKKD